MSKNIIRVSALALVIVMLTAVLASCGGPSGTYESAEVIGSGLSYTFKGSKVTIKVKLLGTVTSFEGKYKIDGEEITFTFEDEDDGADKYSGTMTFEQGDDYIKIGGVKYTKAD